MKLIDLSPFLENNSVTASAPCRLDMGGTLDIRTFYSPLAWVKPCTVNLALDMRTEVRLLPYKTDRVKVSSRGFDAAEFPLQDAPFSHPLGLMFAVAYHFRVTGVHMEIESASPPRSALGGSSVAAVALVAAIAGVLEQIENTPSPDAMQTAVLAHAIEECAAGVPCGMQDQLAAVYGGINCWEWPAGIQAPPFGRKSLLSNQAALDFRRHLLVAYCGVPHVSKDINGTWIRQFLLGGTRPRWIEIARLSRRFADALAGRDMQGAVAAMNHEMAIRKEMTPEVLDDVGDRLAEAAMACGCGARITGAGGGGCIWALGGMNDIERLRPAWDRILSEHKEACILDTGIDVQGVTSVIDCNP